LSRATTSRPLPGVRFDTGAPRLDDPLPRMDVAGFVGFAASGPLHIPVAIDDVGTLHEVFGEEAALAWDPRRGRPVRALLVPAARAFFRNGGRRCWMVRVAGPKARSNQFSLPGLATYLPRATSGRIEAALATASSPGSWSDDLEVATILEVEPFVPKRLRGGARSITIGVGEETELEPGDLVRFPGPEGETALCWIDTVEATLAGSGAPLERRVARASRWLFLRPRPLADVPASGKVRWWVGGRSREAARVLVGTESLVLDLPLREAPPEGSLVELEAAGNLWMRVRRVLPDPTSGDRCSIQGTPVAIEEQQPAWLEAASSAERLSLGLRGRQEQETTLRFERLGFAPRHPRFWASLESDSERFGDRDPSAELLDLHYQSLRQENRRSGGLLSGPRDRWPLADTTAAAGLTWQDGYTFPIDMPLMPETYLGSGEGPGDALERDGLETLDASLFLDPALAELGTEALLAQAAYLRYQAPQPRPLRGIHALLWNEEITLLAVPDAVQRRWERVEDGVSPTIVTPPVQGPEPSPETFADCQSRELTPPRFVEPIAVDARGSFTLAWQFEEQPGLLVELEEATRPDLADAHPLYRGRGRSIAIYGRTAGAYYHRLRVVDVARLDGREVVVRASAWSVGAPVLVPAATRWLVNAPAPFPPRPLPPGPARDGDQAIRLAGVQRCLLRLCAARGDMLAVLALPEHFDEDATLAYLRLLLSPVVDADVVPPVGAGETAIAGYGAVYHPWPLVMEEGRAPSPRPLSPDGVAAGLIADRASRRGAWIAPANEALRGVVALELPIAAERRAELRDAGVNLIVQGPRGFLPLTADTASSDAEVRPINVRRLLTLLRRAALKLGQSYVFEPHDAGLRRAVQRDFESMLGGLFRRGAFAGATPASSFEVDVGPTRNTPSSIDQGRLVVAIKVAPSLPLEFLTVRLVQTGDRALITEGR
jgi:hypothetical protein